MGRARHAQRAAAGACALIAWSLVAAPAVARGESATAMPADTVATASGGGAVADTCVRYDIFVVADFEALLTLQRRLGPDSFAVVLRLNRLDPGHVRAGDTLAVPGTFDPARLSPFPGVLPVAAPTKLLLVSPRVQAFAAYDSGRLVRWGPTSTGREDAPTPAGLYHANWKQRRRLSTVNRGWVLEWYVNLHNRRGISLHKYDLPGYPASHSCVRLLEDDARWLHRWVDTWTLVPGDPTRVARHGTPVVVLDEYDHAAPPPWKRLPLWPRATDVSAADIAAALRRWAVPPPLRDRAPRP